MACTACVLCSLHLKLHGVCTARVLCRLHLKLRSVYGPCLLQCAPKATWCVYCAIFLNDYHPYCSFKLLFSYSNLILCRDSSKHVQVRYLTTSGLPHVHLRRQNGTDRHINVPVRACLDVRLHAAVGFTRGAIRDDGAAICL